MELTLTLQDPPFIATVQSREYLVSAIERVFPWIDSCSLFPPLKKKKTERKEKKETTLMT